MNIMCDCGNKRKRVKLKLNMCLRSYGTSSELKKTLQSDWPSLLAIRKNVDSRHFCTGFTFQTWRLCPSFIDYEWILPSCSIPVSSALKQDVAVNTVELFFGVCFCKSKLKHIDWVGYLGVLGCACVCLCVCVRMCVSSTALTHRCYTYPEAMEKMRQMDSTGTDNTSAPTYCWIGPRPVRQNNHKAGCCIPVSTNLLLSLAGNPLHVSDSGFWVSHLFLATREQI